MKTIRLFFTALFCAAAMMMSGQSFDKELIIEELFSNDGEIYFSFSLPDKAMLNDISRIVSIDGRSTGNTFFAYANSKEFSNFIDLNIEYVSLPHPGDLLKNPNMSDIIDIRDILDWDFYPTYDGYIDMMEQFAQDYPGLCQVFSIGQSVQGRELMFVRISDNVGFEENEPQFLYTSTMHGNELVGYVILLRLIDHLLANYGNNDDITYLVDNIDIWINPLANPDGTYAGGNNTVSGAQRYNANWVDLNRNYPDPEDGPHPDGNEWQAETLAFMQLAEDYDFTAGANIHSGAEVCNYPWDTWPRLHADDNWWTYVCHEYADTAQLYSPFSYMNGFDDGITNGYAWYTIAGGRQDYMNYFHQCREFTLEMSNDMMIPASQLPAHWEYNYRSLLNFMEQSLYGVRGIVRDSATNLPVEAEVFVTMHDLDSSMVFSSLPNGNYHKYIYEGTYTLRFSAQGYYTEYISNVNVTNRESTVLDVELVPNGVGGIESNEISAKVNAFPNPVTDGKMYIQSELNIQYVKVFDLNGKLKGHFPVYDSGTVIHMDHYEPGIYLIKIVTKEGAGLKKVMVVSR